MLGQNKNLVKKILETNFLGWKKFKIVKILESKKILVEKNVWSKKLQKWSRQVVNESESSR